MAGWLDKMLGRVAAGDPIDKVVHEFRDQIPISAMEEERSYGGGGSDGDHVHIHLERGAGGSSHDEDPDPNADPSASMTQTVTPEAFAALSQKVAGLEQMIQEMQGNDEQEVELEEPDTQDRKRFVMRRGAKLKTHDEEPPVPERNPDMIGETDLPGIEDLNKKTADSVPLETLWRDTIAAAEILVPGVRVPTFDAKHHPTLTAKRLCAFRKSVLEQVFPDEAAGPIIRTFVGDSRALLKRLPCDTAKACFNQATAAVKQRNNNGIIRSTAGTTDNKGPVAMTPAEINKRNAEFFAKQNGGGGRIVR